MKARTINAATDGKNVGLALGARTADVLLREYANRPAGGACSPATKRWSEALSLLNEMLGPQAQLPEFMGVIRELDEACGECMVEHEDRAWHAAWAAAMSLK